MIKLKTYCKYNYQQQHLVRNITAEMISMLFAILSQTNITFLYIILISSINELMWFFFQSSKLCFIPRIDRNNDSARTRTFSDDDLINDDDMVSDKIDSFDF